MDAERATASARVTRFPPRVVDVSSDSLSTFSSELELPGGRPGAPGRPEPPRSEGRGSSRATIAILGALVLGQAAVLGWWWSENRAVAVPTRASLTVTSEPSGTPVEIDGVNRGETPFTVELDPGPHALAVGTSTSVWSQTLDVRAGQQATIHVAQAATDSASAEAETGTLEITTEPAGLAVSVDGEPRGVSPVSLEGLDPGVHDVAVTRGGSVVRRAVSVEAGVPTAVLISTSSGGIASGWLTVTGPVPVRIEEAGTIIGNSEAPRILLPVGAHDLEFVNETFGYRERQRVQIATGQAAAVALEPVNGTLSINAQPWGEVWLDGRRIGETPIGNLPLAIGNHELLVRHPQLGERRRTVAVAANTPTRIGIDLRQP